VDTLKAIFDKLDQECRANSMGDLRSEIESLFADAGNDVIWCATVHKSKGLQTRRAFIIEPSKMPHPMAKQPWEKQQEKHIIYIASTRATHELYFVDDKA